MPTVTGKAGLDAVLAALPAQLEQKILKGAMRAAGTVIAEEAQANAVSKEIEVKVRVRSEPGVITARVEVAKGGYLAWWQEHGIAAHLIAVRDERDRGGRTIKRINSLVREGSLKIGGNFVGKVVEHPGVKAKPFMRTALDKKEGDAMEAAARFVAAQLTKQGPSSSAPAGGGDDA